MTFSTTIHTHIKTGPTLTFWATTSRGDVIGLYDAKIQYHAANEALFKLGQRLPYGVSTSYPETYTMTFLALNSLDINEYLATEAARLFVNDISFRIDSQAVECAFTNRYAAIGWPITIARTTPTDQTPCFPGWDDVGHEYLETLDYD